MRRTPILYAVTVAVVSACSSGGSDAPGGVGENGGMAQAGGASGTGGALASGGNSAAGGGSGVGGAVAAGRGGTAGAAAGVGGSQSPGGSSGTGGAAGGAGAAGIAGSMVAGGAGASGAGASGAGVGGASGGQSGSSGGTTPEGGVGGTNVAGGGAGGSGGSGGSSVVPGCTPPSAYPNLFVTVSGHTQAESDAKIAAAWNQLYNPSNGNTVYYDGPGSDESYVKDTGNNDVRTEGMSYGMITAVQLDKQTQFDRLWAWVKNHMAQGTGEIAWHCSTSGGKLSSGGAPDGEEYMATALIFAHNRWGSSGKFDYAVEAQWVLDLIRTKYFNSTYHIVKFVSGSNNTDGSYVLPAFYQVWSCFDTANASFWNEAVTAGREFFKAAADSNGVIPDQSSFTGQAMGGAGSDAKRCVMNIMMDTNFFAADPWQTQTYAPAFGAWMKSHSDGSAAQFSCNALLGFGLPESNWQAFRGQDLVGADTDGHVPLLRRHALHARAAPRERHVPALVLTERRSLPAELRSRPRAKPGGFRASSPSLVRSVTPAVFWGMTSRAVNAARTTVVALLVSGCSPGVAPPARTEPRTPPPAAAAAPAPLVATEPEGDSGVLAREPHAADSSDTPEVRLARYRALWTSERYHPAALETSPRPASLPAGPYACRVSQEYRLRDCTVEKDTEGRTWLAFAGGNLLGMRGVVWDAPGGLAFEGFLTDEEPFGCTSCQDRCIVNPGSCACDPLPPEGVVECLKQPLKMTLKRNGTGRYRGTLVYKVYFNEYVGEGADRHVEGFVPKEERLIVDLVRGAPPEDPNR